MKTTMLLLLFLGFSTKIAIAEVPDKVVKDNTVIATIYPITFQFVDRLLSFSDTMVDFRTTSLYGTAITISREPVGIYFFVQDSSVFLRTDR